MRWNVQNSVPEQEASLDPVILAEVIGTTCRWIVAHEEDAHWLEMHGFPTLSPQSLTTKSLKTLSHIIALQYAGPDGAAFGLQVKRQLQTHGWCGSLIRAPLPDPFFDLGILHREVGQEQFAPYLMSLAGAGIHEELKSEKTGDPSAPGLTIWRVQAPEGLEPECPPLPELPDEDAELIARLAAEGSPWLDAYIELSRHWAPRAYEGYHEACGLFALSTVASRRVRIAFGPDGTYTSLYQALAGRTSLWTKSTAVAIAIGYLRTVGLSALLAPDESTPHAEGQKDYVKGVSQWDGRPGA